MASPFDTLLAQVKNKLSSATQFIKSNPTPNAYLSQQFQSKVAQPVAQYTKPIIQQFGQEAYKGITSPVTPIGQLKTYASGKTITPQSAVQGLMPAIGTGFNIALPVTSTAYRVGAGALGGAIGAIRENKPILPNIQKTIIKNEPVGTAAFGSGPLAVIGNVAEFIGPQGLQKGARGIKAFAVAKSVQKEKDLLNDVPVLFDLFQRAKSGFRTQKGIDNKGIDELVNAYNYYIGKKKGISVNTMAQELQDLLINTQKKQAGLDYDKFVTEQGGMVNRINKPSTGGEILKEPLKIFHGTSKENLSSIKSKGLQIEPEGRNNLTGGSSYGVSFSTDKNIAAKYGNQYGNTEIFETTLPKGSKVKVIDSKGNGIDEVFTYNDLQNLKKQGYDAIHDISEGQESEIRLLNSKITQESTLAQKQAQLKELGAELTDMEQYGDPNEFPNYQSSLDEWEKLNDEINKIKSISGGEIPKGVFEPPQGSMGFVGKAQFKQPIKVPEQPRGFVKTLQQSPRTMKQVKERLQGTFTPITNKETLKEAQKVVSSNFEASRQRVLNEPLTAETSAMGQDLIRRYQNAKQWDSAVEIAEAIAKKATTQGQAIQALSMWSRLTPEGALKYSQRLIQRAKQVNGVDYVLSSDKARKITEIAKSIQKMEGQERILRTADLMAEFSTVVPSSLASKISTIQTMAQLLNPKTAIRNLGGNLGFQGIENVSRAVATPIDIATSLVTGKRSTVLPSLSVQAQGLARGWREGVRDALRGIDTSATSTQYELPRSTFSGKVGKGFEKLLNLELRAPDRAFYTSAVEESLNNQMRAAGVKIPTDAMKEIAHADGLYRTFQDENIATKIFTGIKRGLNAGKEFGLGDLVLKYPKTPASLLMRGIDYSPMGFVKTVYEMAKPLMGKEFNQRDFVNSFSRALVGTGGLMTTGAILYNAGIITGKQEKDYDISSTQKEMGLGGYKVNVSALKRFVLSGFDTEAAKRQEGDTLINYDWIQPMAIGVSMGANIAENNGKVKDGSMLSTILSSVAGGAETLAEQPLIQGIQKLAKGQGIVQAITETIKGTPASFVPQIANQVNQVMDNRSRITQSPDFMTEMGNLVKAKIPGLAQTLPGKFTVWGEPMERYQGDSNTLFNVFFNPAFVTKLKTTPEGQEVIDIFEQSGEKTQAPRVVENKIKINGQDKELTGEEIATYQQYIGTKTKDIFNQLVQEPTFKQLGNEEKANAMANILSDINSAAKIELFGNEPKNVPKKVQSILSGSQVGYIPKVESDGSVKMIDTAFQPTKPTLTGYAELDKKALSKYNSEITQKVNDVYDLFLAGKLSANDANTQIAKLKGTTIKVGKKTPKPIFKTRKLPKLKALKVKKAKKIKVPKIKPVKLLKVKV